MGNRAVIIESRKREGIYQHWNGGRDSIEPMLYYAKHFLNDDSNLFENNLKKVAFISMCCGFRPEYSNDYDNLDCNNGDNGVYVINKDFDIIERRFYKYSEQNNYKFEDFLIYIDELMPKNFQKGKDFILKYIASKEVEKRKVFDISFGARTEDIIERVDFDEVNNRLEVGDVIYYRNQFFTIIGKNDSEELTINGSNRANKVFFNFTENYGKDDAFYMDSKDPKNFENFKANPNSYLSYTYCKDVETGETIKVLDDDNFKIIDKDKLDKYIKSVENSNKNSN